MRHKFEFIYVWSSGKIEKKIYSFRTDLEAYTKRYELIADSCYNILDIKITQLD